MGTRLVTRAQHKPIEYASAASTDLTERPQGARCSVVAQPCILLTCMLAQSIYCCRLLWHVALTKSAGAALSSLNLVRRVTNFERTWLARVSADIFKFKFILEKRKWATFKWKSGMNWTLSGWDIWRQSCDFCFVGYTEVASVKTS